MRASERACVRACEGSCWVVVERKELRGEFSHAGFAFWLVQPRATRRGEGKERLKSRDEAERS